MTDLMVRDPNDSGEIPAPTEVFEPPPILRTGPWVPHATDLTVLLGVIAGPDTVAHHPEDLATASETLLEAALTADPPQQPQEPYPPHPVPPPVAEPMWSRVEQRRRQRAKVRRERWICALIALAVSCIPTGITLLTLAVVR